MNRKQFLIFTLVIFFITFHFVQWCWHRDLKRNVIFLYSQMNIINDAAKRTAEILEEHLTYIIEIERARRMQ